jgi:ankyrin repeat protein
MKILLVLVLLMPMSVFCAEAPLQQSQQSMASLAGLPTELKQQISRINAQTGPLLNIAARAKGILNLAATNRAFRAAVNDPKNMLIILQSLPTKAAALYLADKLAQMPGIQSKQVQEWLKSIKLEKGFELWHFLRRNFFATPAEVAVFLANPNIDLNWNKNNRSPLIEVIDSSMCKRNCDIPKLLLAAGANPNTGDLIRTTPLMIAAKNNNLDFVKLLIDSGANVNLQNTLGTTALLYAFYHRPNIDIVRLLIAAGADVNLKDIEDSTALMLATGWNNPDLTRLILEAGAKTDIQRKRDGTTALMKAVGNVEEVRHLLSAGANPDLQNSEGKTARDLARNTIVIELLDAASLKKRKNESLELPAAKKPKQ